MAIRITFSHETNEQMIERLEAFDKALKGSSYSEPGWAEKDDELAIYVENATTFTLYIGLDNDNDVDITI